MKHEKWRILLYGIILAVLILGSEFVSAETDGETLNLRQTIEAALKANLEPMNPVPPVIKTFITQSLLSL